MWNPLKAAFSMPEIVTAAISGGDKIVFTQEERKDWLLEAAKVLGPQTVARRVLTFCIAFIWALLTLIGAGLIIVDHPQIATFLQFYMVASAPFGIAVGFYYGVAVKREGSKDLQKLIKSMEKKE